MIPADQRPGAVPVGYHETLHWTITGNSKRVLAMNLAALPLFVVLGALFFWLARGPGRLPAHFSLGLPALLAILLGTILTFVLHELVHGMCMRLFGARPQYGVMWAQGMFYATAPGFAFPRNAYLVIALAPLIDLSVLAILGIVLLAGTPWVALLALCAAMNGSGAIGDLWIASMVSLYPAPAYVIDERDGIRVFMPEG